MFKIDTANAATVMPTPQAPGPHVDGFFTHGDSTGTDQSDLPVRVSRDWLNALQEEICYVITSQDIILNKADRTQLYDGINAMASGVGPDPGILQDVEDDPAPKLGGDLEVDGNKIIGAGGTGDIVLAPVSGNIILNSTPTRVKTDIAHRGDINNKITFGTDTQSLIANGSIIQKIAISGLQLGNANAIVTSIDNDDTLASDSSTLLTTMHAAKKYLDDEIAANLPGTPSNYYLDFWTDSPMSPGTGYGPPAPTSGGPAYTLPMQANPGQTWGFWYNPVGPIISGLGGPDNAIEGLRQFVLGYGGQLVKFEFWSNVDSNNSFKFIIPPWIAGQLSIHTMAHYYLSVTKTVNGSDWGSRLLGFYSDGGVTSDRIIWRITVT